MIKIVWSKNFEKRLKKWIEKHSDLKVLFKEKLELFSENPYTQELKNHKLSGKLKDLRAISITYDYRLVFYHVNENEVMLVDIGTHEEVY